MNTALKQVPSIADFARGQRDYQEHKEADEDGSEDYNRGYGYEYEMAEIRSAGEFN